MRWRYYVVRGKSDFDHGFPLAEWDFASQWNPCSRN